MSLSLKGFSEGKPERVASLVSTGDGGVKVEGSDNSDVRAEGKTGWLSLLWLVQQVLSITNLENSLPKSSGGGSGGLTGRWGLD